MLSEGKNNFPSLKKKKPLSNRNQTLIFFPLRCAVFLSFLPLQQNFMKEMYSVFPLAHLIFSKSYLDIWRRVQSPKCSVNFHRVNFPGNLPLAQGTDNHGDREGHLPRLLCRWFQGNHFQHCQNIFGFETLPTGHPGMTPLCTALCSKRYTWRHRSVLL